MRLQNLLCCLGTCDISAELLGPRGGSLAALRLSYGHELVLQLYPETLFSLSFFNRTTTTTWAQLDRNVIPPKTAWQILEVHFAELL